MTGYIFLSTSCYHDDKDFGLYCSNLIILNCLLSNYVSYFFLEWETVRSSETVKEPVQTTQSTTVDKTTVITTQTETYTQSVAMLQVSIVLDVVPAFFI